jgi:TorA maturation chaperone TorD
MDRQLLDRESRPVHAQMLQLAGTRYVTYRVLASAFLPPTQERVNHLAMMSSEIIDDPMASRFPYFSAWRDFLLDLDVTAENSVPVMRRLYDKVFSSSEAAARDILHESQYRSGGEQVRSDGIRDLVNRYNNVGLTVGVGSAVPPDHISVQLEYLAVLCDLEATGWNDEDPRQAVRALRLIRTHLQKHLCWWLPGFERNISLRAPESIYLRAAQAATEFTHHERDLLDMIIQIYEQAPSPEGGARNG